MILYRSAKQKNIPDNELWLFSKNLYQRTGVAVSCLHLQNHYAININLLLACLWLADSGRGTLTQQDLAALILELAPWQKKITEETRKLRQQLPKQSKNEKLQEIRKLVLNTELFTEKVQQSILHDKLCKYTIKEADKKALDGMNNIVNYFSAANLVFDEPILAHTKSLLAATFTDFNEVDMQHFKSEGNLCL